jgi:predicted NUDIX family NTP pyrophosphohydrolase
MAKQSAGILLFRRTNGELEILLAHPGGPFFAKKDLGAWSVPKGEFDAGEKASDAARREFLEETGCEITGELIELTPVTQKAGKKVFCWAVEQDADPAAFVSNTFQIEWPPRSGKFTQYPEIDRAEWFPSYEAKQKINPAQAAFIDELIEKIKRREI